MKKGDLITGMLVGFTYVGSDVKYCRVSVKDDKGVIHKGIAGTADIFDFATMLTLKGAGARAHMIYDGQETHSNGQTYAKYIDCELSLV